VVNLADHRRKFLEKGTNSVFVPSGHLIYTKRNVLYAVPFEPDKLEIRGTAVPVLDDIEPDDAGFGEISVSQNGTLVYRRANGAAAGESTIDWLDDTGRKQPLLAKPGFYSNPRFSPDGKRLAMVVREPSGQTVSVYNLERGTNTQLSASSGTIPGLAWSTDGRYVVFGGVGTLLMAVRSDGSGKPQPLFQSASFQSDNGFPAPIPSFFTPDGKKLAFSDVILAQIWTVPVQDQGGQLKAGQPEQFLKTASRDQSPAVSPNGRWLAYQSQSNATGKFEIYVRAFSGAGDQVQVSNNGGTQPVWSPNKHDLLYQSGDQIMAVSYVEKGDIFVPDPPRVWLAKLDGATGWDLNPDGKRVAAIMPSHSETDHVIVMWQNFFDYLRQRVPVK
jgi:dipeptidyl aminopeptidase/acylaminoacyl peptidase